MPVIEQCAGCGREWERHNGLDHPYRPVPPSEPVPCAACKGWRWVGRMRGVRCPTCNPEPPPPTAREIVRMLDAR